MELQLLYKNGMLMFVFSMMPAGVSAKAHVGEKTDSVCLSPKLVQLQGDLRKLWIDHAVWTKKYVVSALANLPDQQEMLARLLQNQQDIGDAFKPYYGEEAGNKLAELQLLTDQIVVRIKNDWKGDTAAYDDKYETQIIHMADAFTEGIVKQFPGKF
ncbi:hypothetical protein [Paenibacillus sp. GCM10023250]|uniref:hypothetical protein n=1 Tax=Paenibacillus sp. GCM10023250 TaxID=3252648 RepID=UPI0036098D3E